METQNLEIEYSVTEAELRTSYNNMLCIVTYEPLPKEVQAEIEQLMAVAE